MGAVTLRSPKIHKVFEGWAIDAASQDTTYPQSRLWIDRQGFKILFPGGKRSTKQNETKGEECNMIFAPES
jgi:hypothetical protein